MKYATLFFALISIPVFSKEITCQCNTISYNDWDNLISLYPTLTDSELEIEADENGQTEIIEIKSDTSCEALRSLQNVNARYEYLLAIEEQESWNCNDQIKYISCKKLTPPKIPKKPLYDYGYNHNVYPAQRWFDGKATNRDNEKFIEAQKKWAESLGKKPKSHKQKTEELIRAMGN